MARDSTTRTSSIDPTTGTAASSQTVGASQTKSGKGKNPDTPFKPKRARSSRRDPEPKDEEEDEQIPETPKKKNPGGDPGSDPDPKGGSSKQDGPKGPTQVKRRIVDKEDPIPKLNHLLSGTDNFARWYKGLKLYLEMKDLDAYGEFSYWQIVEGTLEKWDEGIITENEDMSYRKWRKANAFILLTIRKNSEEGPFKLIGLCDTGAEGIRILKNHYANRTEADLGIALTDITTICFKEDGPGIESHIEIYEKRGEKIVTIASGNLKPAYVDAGKILQLMGSNELLKKELLLATLPKGIMRYAPLVQNTRRDDSSYRDVISQLKQYVPS